MSQSAHLIDHPSAQFAPEFDLSGCPGCFGSDQTTLFTARRVPQNIGVLPRSRAEALAAPTGDIVLVYCRGCGLVYNRDFVLPITLFTPEYDVVLHHSPVFRKFLHEVANRLIQRYALHGKSILEIGCNDGYFLRLLCRLGSNDGMGLDPTVRNPGQETLDGCSITWIRDYFAPRRHGHLPADFICCQSVFEVIPRPLQLLKELRETIGSRSVAMYFEVFNAASSLARRETWSVHYELCNYFSLDCFAELFARAGFDVVHSGTCYEEAQYLYVEAVPAANTLDHSGLAGRDWSQMPDEVAAFAEHYQAKLHDWKERLQHDAAAGRRVVVWGSGGKGISFLNALAGHGQIEYVVDINPDRQGRYIPVCGQQVVGPEFLRQYRPDVIVLTNPLYEAEIRGQVSQLGLDCEFHHA